MKKVNPEDFINKKIKITEVSVYKVKSVSSRGSIENMINYYRNSEKFSEEQIYDEILECIYDDTSRFSNKIIKQSIDIELC